MLLILRPKFRKEQQKKKQTKTTSEWRDFFKKKEMKRLAKQWQENKDMITVDKYLKYANTREKSLTELVQKDAAMSRRIKLRRQKKALTES